jgi:two-component system, sensor histidine kinase and response regulator
VRPAAWNAEAGGENMTSDVAAAEQENRELFVARFGVGLWLFLVALGLFALADVRLADGGSTATRAVRVVQFLLVGWASWATRRRPAPERLAAVAVVFISGIYVTSATAGYLRGDAVTQPITDLVIAFGTATTLPWTPWHQLVSVLVAMLAIGGNVYFVKGGLAEVTAHVAAGVVVAFATSVYIAWQLDRHRRARDRAERALRQSEKRFRALVEHAPDVITIVDRDLIILYESPPLEAVVGFRPEEVCETSVLDYVHPDDLEAVTAGIESIRRDGESRVLECRCRRKDGAWIDVEGICTNLYEDPSVGGMVINWRDVSERKRSEAERAVYMGELAAARDEALSSTRAKSDFLANMSHEIRTPMNAIIGMTDMALDTELTAEQQDYLSTVRSSAIALLGLLNDVLDYSKIEAGKLSIETVDVDLRAIVDDVAELFARAAAQKGLEMVCAIDPVLPERLRGDPVRLRQVLTNLVGNAVKFTERGEVVIELRVVRATVGGVSLEIAVADTGIGIAPEHREAIFESFTQADMSTTRRFGGTGLGLAISRQLAELMGARIAVESELGRGSRFRLELTLPMAGPVDAPQLPAGFTPPRVLIVDPNAAARGALRRQLAHWLCPVGEAASGGEAFDMLLRGRYQLALVAVRLGDMTADDLALAVGARPHLADLRLVLCAASIGRSPDGGRFVGVLAKPWRRTALLRTVVDARGEPRAGQTPVIYARINALRVLLVEDNATARRVAAGMLERLGVSVDAVTNGREAVAAVGHTTYDVVLMDVQMPEMDGFEATRRIRAAERPGAPIPIVAMTAHAMVGDRERCLAAGMSDYLAKPVRPADLERVLARWAPRPEPVLTARSA